MIYEVRATVDDLSHVMGVRHDAKSALELADEYRRQGFTNIRVNVGDDTFALEQFRMLVE